MSSFSSTAGSRMISVDEGRAAVFDITVVNSYPPATMKWYKSNGIPVPMESQQYHVTLKSQLIVLSTQVDRDNGTEFQVTASNMYTQQTSTGPSFNLIVRS